MRKRLLAPVAAGVLLALAGTAHAAQKTSSFQVSATVSKNCLISAGNLSLGTFTGDNDLAATSGITVKCTSGTTYDVNLSAGNSGSYASRTLSNGTDTLVYNLYTDAGYTTVWGDGSTGGTGRLGGTGAGMGTEQTLVVRGRLLASQNAGPVGVGTYTDTIIATIVY